MRTLLSWSSRRYTQVYEKSVILAGIAGIQTTWMYLSSPVRWFPSSCLGTQTAKL